MLELQVEGHQQERITKFVDVILPLAISKKYTYRVPYELTLSVAVGKRVIVQFGKSKIYAAVVYAISSKAPERYEAKYILDVLDDSAIITSDQLKLWDWVSDYYMCHIGEVMQAAMPAVFKLASETKIMASAQLASVDRTTLNDKEYLILDALDLAGELKVSDIIKLLGQKTVFPILKSLFSKDAIVISEELRERYKPKKKAFVILHSLFDSDEERRLLLDSLERAPKQQDAVLAYFQLRRKGA